MKIDKDFCDIVERIIDDDKSYLQETAKEDYIANTEIEGYTILSGRVVVNDFEAFCKTCAKSPAIALRLNEHFNYADVWANYIHGWSSREEFFSAIRCAAKEIENNYADTTGCWMDDNELIGHEIGSNYFTEFYWDIEKQEIVKVVQEYSTDLDMTLIFRHPKADKGGWDDYMEIVNYYYGEPSDTDLNEYYK